MLKAYACPYLTGDGGLTIRCEAGKITFKDRTSRIDYANRFCANRECYKNCTLCRNLNEYYERTMSNGT